MTDNVHLVRPHTFASEQSYTLGPETLEVRHRDKEVSIPYSDITSVRVISYANAGAVHYQCTVKTRSHGKLNLRSHHYRSLGNFEDRTGTYNPFVRELIRRVHAHSPDAQFLKGSGVIQALWAIVLLICVGGWIVFGAILLEGGADPMASVGFLGVLVAATYFSFRWVQQSKPERFDPNELPS